MGFIRSNELTLAELVPLLEYKEAHDDKCDKCTYDDESQPTRKDPNCICGEPLWICLKPGQHIHPCPVHPDYVIYGSDASF